MPNVSEVKSELKRLKIKGLTGKCKLELIKLLPPDHMFANYKPQTRKVISDGS